MKRQIIWMGLIISMMITAINTATAPAQTVVLGSRTEKFCEEKKAATEVTTATNNADKPTPQNGNSVAEAGTATNMQPKRDNNAANSSVTQEATKTQKSGGVLGVLSVILCIILIGLIKVYSYCKKKD